MRKLVLFSIIGFFAQLVDGALGMAYGATSASLLLMLGMAPAAASASIHMAEIVTTAASGASHLWLGNVDRRMLLRLVVPGAISAFIGAALLVRLPGEMMRPFVSGFLTLLGLYIVIRFLCGRRAGIADGREKSGIPGAFLAPLGFVGGFLDAVGGGGWGPIATPAMLAKGGASPRKVIGTVDTGEFAVAAAATLGFVLFLGWEQVSWIWVGALVIGGVAAAPLAAWLVKIIPSYLMGVLVGGFIIVTNVRTLVLATKVVSGSWMPAIYGILSVCWGAAIVYQIVNRDRFIRQSSRTAV